MLNMALNTLSVIDISNVRDPTNIVKKSSRESLSALKQAHFSLEALTSALVIVGSTFKAVLF